MNARSDRADGHVVRGSRMRPVRPAAGARESVSALERGFAVLHCFEAGLPSLSHQEITRKTGLPKATVSRVTQTLVKLGYLDGSHDDGRFRLTAKTLSVGQIYLSNVDVRAIAQPLMRELADATKATVNLVVRSGDHLVVVATVRSDQALVSINSRIGFAFPILQTAIGRAYLCGLPRAEQADTIRALRGTVPSHAWKAMQGAALDAIATFAKTGYCALMGEWRSGVNSVAVPVWSRPDGELYVINCAGPSMHLSPEGIEQHVAPSLLQIARRIEQSTNVNWRPA
ncbi:MAG: IclR family transcriptional regulator [Gammaproteobacteria bacterium]|nr:IclR family transcriptional regulator [Gammaproteobacteria bacterium]MBU1440989.1 IclR family transcriptional regulator [Gammaproteobacteria bacterium]MBU2285654.1 IclR family transcriptional regulator [Gammaproteobacteria bacterium]